ncbi:sulfite exporter TauE/SafE family protein [Desulfobulbus alkaliphilus]|uniref:sulfite exporter TauE/SafE family protein n=1 Tax=Desulfobulbus alkaliphilus TaxID=869814 RepID=UPI001965F0D9|nr:sulfite exporter TauE/SafE family protein [Desulfobulbus alkaliphilus]MBM9536323.1 sulfite exporter TauE/SafE family protein [Desulfobulbus alkaliphilus]
MLFPVAGIEVAPWIPFVAGFAVAFICSMGGVSGANLLLPFQMSVLGFVTPAVSATNHLFNIVAIPSGVYRFIREGRMVWPLTWVVIAGTVPGVLLGVIFRVRYLPDPTHFKIFAGCVLLYIGGTMVRSLVKKPAPGMDKASSEKRFQELVSRFHKQEAASREPLPRVTVDHFGLKKITYSFYGETISAPTMGIFMLSAIVGVVGGMYGIGGGAIIAPFFVAVFHLPVYTIAGACLMGTFLTSLVAAGFFQILAPFYPHMAVAPDWMLGILMGTGGMIGMYVGARMQKFVPATVIKWLLACILLFTGGRYVLGFLF